MKNWLSQNWFKFVLLVVIIAGFLLIFGFQSDKNQAQAKDCAKQAQMVLENEIKASQPDVSFSQRNHYNHSLNKCLVEINASMPDGANGVIFTSEIRDAYEQKTFITCSSGSSVATFCFVPINSSPTGKLIKMTKEEADAKILDYMNE